MKWMSAELLKNEWEGVVETDDEMSPYKLANLIAY